ncbi:MAG: flagellar hook protein FlgE [Tepidanaerobacteraceae bacterium]|jgi:flagellar hook protein FlgE
MMRSMFSGVTGLRNHQIKMDVIGNNIANVNTVGFKKSRVTFQDALSQTIRGASSAQGGRGGTNPMQVGLGMEIASIDTLHYSTSAESTGNITDLAIGGEGMFILSDGLNRYYTRAGNFIFDEKGNFISSSNGLKVLGWQYDITQSTPPDKTPQNLEQIIIKKGMMVPANATSLVKFDKNLNAETSEGDHYKIPFHIYDSLGREHTLEVTFTKSSQDNTWNYVIEADPDDVLIENIRNIDGTIVFDENGFFDPNATGVIDQVEIDISGSTSVQFTPDFDQVTQYAKETSIDLMVQDGYAAGTLLGITIDITGTITGVFDNGLNQELAQIAIANFDNPGGLIKKGQNLYELSNNSGRPQIGTAGTGGRGTLSPGSLEMSNVDLSEEFTQMIITQRGFQANSRIISTSDEILQELVNLKR